MRANDRESKEKTETGTNGESKEETVTGTNDSKWQRIKRRTRNRYQWRIKRRNRNSYQWEQMLFEWEILQLPQLQRNRRERPSGDKPQTEVVWFGKSLFYIKSSHLRWFLAMPVSLRCTLVSDLLFCLIWEEKFWDSLYCTPVCQEETCPKGQEEGREGSRGGSQRGHPRRWTGRHWDLKTKVLLLDSRWNLGLAWHSV